MLKILFLTRSYLPHLGGVEIHINRVADLLHKLGHQVTIITGTQDSHDLSETKLKSTLIYRIPLYLTSQNSKNILYGTGYSNTALSSVKRTSSIATMPSLGIFPFAFSTLPSRFLLPSMVMKVSVHPRKVPL